MVTVTVIVTYTQSNLAKLVSIHKYELMGYMPPVLAKGKGTPGCLKELRDYLYTSTTRCREQDR
jgi:hypothetical protein